MDQPVKAEGFIWLVIGVFWVIAQIAGAAAKKKQPHPPLSNNREEDGPPLADPITELLRKMSGIEEFRTESPSFTEEPQKVPVVTRENPWSPGEIEKLPDIKPLRRAAPITEVSATAEPALPRIDVRQKMSAFRTSVPTIKLPAMNLSFHGSETSVRKAPAVGSILNPSDKNSLRRAMLSHIIFSPPKALEQPNSR
jgi:hypothetical protein